MAEAVKSEERRAKSGEREPRMRRMNVNFEPRMTRMGRDLLGKGRQGAGGGRGRAWLGLEEDPRLVAEHRVCVLGDAFEGWYRLCPHEAEGLQSDVRVCGGRRISGDPFEVGNCRCRLGSEALKNVRGYASSKVSLLSASPAVHVLGSHGAGQMGEYPGDDPLLRRWRIWVVCYPAQQAWDGIGADVVYCVYRFALREAAYRGVAVNLAPASESAALVLRFPAGGQQGGDAENERQQHSYAGENEPGPLSHGREDGTSRGVEEMGNARREGASGIEGEGPRSVGTLNSQLPRSRGPVVFPELLTPNS